MGKGKLVLAILIGLHIFLLSKLVFFPYPELFVYPYLTNHGLVPYADILDQHFPGLMFLPVNLGNLGMTTPQIARLWHIALVAVSQLLLFLIAKKMFKSEKKALVANFLYLVWQPLFEGTTLWIDSFITPITLAAFYLLWDTKGRRVFWAGVLLGIGLIFKQVVGPLIALATLFTYLQRRKLKEPLTLALGASIPAILLLAYILWIGVLDDFYFWTITFNLTTFAQMGRKYATITELIKSGSILLPAAAVGLYLIVKKRWDCLLLVVFFVGNLLFAYARFDFVHLQPSLPFALLLVGLLLKNLQTKFSVLLVLVFLLPALPFLYTFYAWNLNNKVSFFGEEEKQIVSLVKNEVVEGESVFAFATFPHLYQMAERLPPGKVFVFHFPWFMVHAEDRVLSGIIKDPPKMVVQDRESAVDGKNLASFMPRIASYLDANYVPYKKIGSMEVLIPR